MKTSLPASPDDNAGPGASIPSMTDDVAVLQKPAPCTLDELKHALRKPLRELGVERAIVFGSWARGEADGFSDLDLLVVIETDLGFAQRGALLGEALDRIPVGVDLLVYTPLQFAAGLRRGYGVFDAVIREGVDLL